ncbi:hypothetical protein ET445_06430 [Agromyces protaetiae]|uniref:Uncharacterized protein n=1 Tax=Agromyces protaetiae TaxID=2509455 RepID=A0A4P6FBC1_9MICO|nr:hypothetical protein [Agromyces protaetiae]QAY73035.1 hypothetical protein ET445_06430 [Agromyces protaetiae]
MGESKTPGIAVQSRSVRESRLAERMGLSPDVAVAVRGDLAIPELADALDGLDRALPWDAGVVVTVVQTYDQLDGLSAWLLECGVSAPTWVVYGGGLAGTPGDEAVRDALRDAGFTALRACAVSYGWQAVQAAPPRFA